MATPVSHVSAPTGKTSLIDRLFVTPVVFVIAAIVILVLIALDFTAQVGFTLRHGWVHGFGTAWQAAPSLFREADEYDN